MIYRLFKPLKTQSFFLFGARGTGKSTFISNQFLGSPGVGKSHSIDLLDSDTESSYRSDPSRLEALDKSIEWVFIDEIQKVPALLDHVHRLIEKRKHKFVLTGSSARKLKRGGANLLAGRAFWGEMFPLTFDELGSQFHLEEVLRWGSLPKLLEFSEIPEKAEFLRSYVQVYLKEEILVEQLVRRTEPFKDFLEIAGQCSGKILSYSRIAKDIGVDHKTVETFFGILEDTHIGFRLPGFHRSVRKSQHVHPKFYVFDLGVKRALERSLNDGFSEGSHAFGAAFEHFVMIEILRRNSYARADFRFSYLRTKDDAEVDLVLTRGRHTILVEIKSYRKVDLSDVRRLSVFKQDITGARAFLLSRDPEPIEIEGVRCLSWDRGIPEIMGGL